MRLRLAAALLLLAFPASAPAASPKIYLSLGDSLAAGYLSPQRPLSNQGYALNGSAGRTQATAYVNSFVGPLNAIMRSMYAGLRVEDGQRRPGVLRHRLLDEHRACGRGDGAHQRGEDVHAHVHVRAAGHPPNAQGYGVIAQAFAAALR
jgi:hypothetical protein